MSRTQIDDSGNVFYYLDGGLLPSFHREDGPAIEWSDGSRSWYINGKRHRTNAPAIININGHKEWWCNGELHREDGPAVEYSSGDKQWYYHGKHIDCNSTEEFLRLIKLKIFW